MIQNYVATLFAKGCSDLRWIFAQINAKRGRKKSPLIAALIRRSKENQVNCDWFDYRPINSIDCHLLVVKCVSLVNVTAVESVEWYHYCEIFICVKHLFDHHVALARIACFSRSICWLGRIIQYNDAVNIKESLFYARWHSSRNPHH